MKLPGRPNKADDMKRERGAGEALESSLQETANIVQVQGPASEAVKRVYKHVHNTSWHALFMASGLLLSITSLLTSQRMGKTYAQALDPLRWQLRLLRPHAWNPGGLHG